MSRRSRPQYRSGLGWILGVAFEDTLTRPVRLAQGFTCVRCCGTPRASSPHDLTAPALASHDGRDCVQLPLARGCYHLAPRRTFTSNPVPMPGTPSATAFGGFGLDKRLASDILRRQGFDGQERTSSGPPTRLPGPDTTQIFLLTKKTSYKGRGLGETLQQHRRQPSSGLEGPTPDPSPRISPRKRQGGRAPAALPLRRGTWHMRGACRAPQTLPRRAVDPWCDG